MTTPRFSGGTNIAMTIPAVRYDETLSFYRDVLGMHVEEEAAPAVGMVSRSARTQFGPCTLWFDCVDNYARSDIWLELRTDDLDAALSHLEVHGVKPQDELEALPEGSRGHWVSNPVAVPHMLSEGPKT